MDFVRRPSLANVSVTMESNRRSPESTGNHQPHYDDQTIRSSLSQNNDGTSEEKPFVDGDQATLEDAQFIFGRNVAFKFLPNDESYNAEEEVERLSKAVVDGKNADATTVISIPKDKVTSFREQILRERLFKRSRQVVERAGHIAFWRGNEPFMRPVLSRSLSLP